ncbi:MarR family transcriptional regulator [Streptomyces tirandamycinicus]|uniref:MarR family transcriptional regulator n=1 Tax=Streptomyces tirandamycinicus TaxID=2174846 RepID=A0A2S1ST72_9ACTN|nr:MULTISPECIES: MarR family transcriptional regulator [Streptomyces]AWI29601.1 MarR family transcriptional regulator [Streptomyces tirandamycinicus]MCY0982834.1 MarR family transcriptional regulator [Streptomyces tirandamycinicus]NNJ03295.1 MarR family transcriptional regulator [Streptomyces sp. PKU-MA01144]TFE48145.1 MarR family transcriptional regulator [Streptomyces sp. ICN441]
MATRKLTPAEMSEADHAFYGLVWAGTVLIERVDRALTKAHDLPVSWFEVMLWLAGRDEPVAASVLGNSTMLSRSQVSRVLDALQARGLVSRTPSARDARSVEVALTPEGRAVFEEADATRRACLAPVFTDVLDREDMEALGAVWRKLKAHKDS